jgi:uncharacterized protein YeaO (DUF488 family)
MPNLGPSERLVSAVQDGKITWARFSRAYRKELYLDRPIDKRSRTIKNHGQKLTLRLLKRLARAGRVTLLCDCGEDEEQCHRHLLRRLITQQSGVTTADHLSRSLVTSATGGANLILC